MTSVPMRTAPLFAPSGLLFSATAFASPWTLPADRIAVVGQYDFAYADSEYFLDSGSRRFPLNGRYSASTFTLSGRFGFTDRLEFQAVLPIKLVSYTADPVILLDSGTQEPEAFDFYQENVINLSRTARGLGDISLFARYRFLLSPFALAGEFGVKAPTGYRAPSGTFGDRPSTQQEFLADLRRFVQPENIQDDVTLGDGQLDLSVKLLCGFLLPTHTFLRIDAGYRLRLGGAGDQLLGEFRAGQLVTRSLLIYGAIGGHYTVEDGDVIGISVAADDPNVPARDYGNLNNLNLRELRLQNDLLQVGGGLIVRLTPTVEFNLGYLQTVWGRNTAKTQTFSVSIAMSTSFEEE